MTKIKCSKCRKEKVHREFVRNGNKYKSCNFCSIRSDKVVDDAFNMAFELFNKHVEKEGE